MVKKHKSMCLLCSMGCGFIIETMFDEAVNLEYDRDDPVGKGALCSKGNFALELLNHPLRLIEPRTGSKTLNRTDAFHRLAVELTPLARESSVGLILSGDVSVEDAATAKLFAEKCLNNGHCAVYCATGDDKVFRALADASIPNPPAQVDDIENARCMVAVGDPFEVSPVIAGRVLHAKYTQRGTILAAVSKKPNRTSRFASIHLIGQERRTLAELLRVISDITGESAPAWKRIVKDKFPAPDDPAVEKLGSAFVTTPSAVMLLETQDPVTAQLAALIVGAAGTDKRLYSTCTYGNAAGICHVTAGMKTVDDIIDAAHRDELKALIVLGADIHRLNSDGKVKSALEKMHYLVAGAPFENATTRRADMVLPTALWLETEGTFNGRYVMPVVEPPGGALSCGEILKRIAHEMECALPPVSIESVLSLHEPTEELIESILENSDVPAPEPACASTAVRYADGSLTDLMSWVMLQERKAW